MPVKVFTIEEANRLIPSVRRSLEGLQVLVRRVIAAQDAIAVLRMLGAESPASPEHGDFDRRQEELDEALRDYARSLEDLQAAGCVLKDVHRGIVDFYGLKDGRLIFLCWRLGEETIGYWHELDAGMVGRRPVSEL